MCVYAHLVVWVASIRKNSCSSFPRSVPNKALSLFPLVHSNIWGLSLVTSTFFFYKLINVPWYLSYVDIPKHTNHLPSHEKLYQYFCNLDWWLFSIHLVVLRNINWSCFPYSNPFIMKLEFSLVFPFIFFVVIMFMNMSPIFLRHSWLLILLYLLCI